MVVTRLDGVGVYGGVSAAEVLAPPLVCSRRNRLDRYFEVVWILNVFRSGNIHGPQRVNPELTQVAS